MKRLRLFYFAPLFVCGFIEVCGSGGSYPLIRTSSEPSFPQVDLPAFPTDSLEECRDFMAEKFPGYSFVGLYHSLKEDSLLTIEMFDRLLSKGFRFQERTIGGKTVHVMDVSWPVVRTLTYQKLKGKRKDALDASPLTAENINFILEKIKPFDKARTRGDFNLDDETVSFLEKAFIGENRVFYFGFDHDDPIHSRPFDEEGKQKFMANFRLTLKNPSGFQRMMSVLCSQIVSGCASFKSICLSLGASSVYRGGIRLSELDMEEDESAFYHEALSHFHGYAYIKYYPMLRPEIMDPFIDRFVELLPDMKKMIKLSGEWLQNNWELKALFINFATRGILKNLFPDFDPKGDWLSKRNLAKALYLNSIFEKYLDPWSSWREIFVILGMTPFKIGGHLLVIENRQNEEIFNIRNSNDAQDKEKYYRLHGIV